MSFTPNYTSDEELAFFGQPGVALRARDLSPELRAQLVRDLKQFRRAESGERARPDIYSPEHNEPSVANKHGFPTPFGPRDTHRPDRAESPDALRHVRAINQRIEDEGTTHDLQKRMSTDADHPLPPVTMRDQIEAAVATHNLSGDL
jgi:hypothetical protein